MMKVAQINMLHYGSTGKIMLGIAECARKEGMTAKTFSPRIYQRHSRMQTPEIDGHTYFGSDKENKLHYAWSRLTAMNGVGSYFGTRELLKQLDQFSPDIVHLHNLHNCSFRLPMLFRYLRKKKIKVVWTLHDCWTMTGKCPYFDMVKCVKWKTGCHHCSQLRSYPGSYIDMTKFMWKRKQKWFTSVEDMMVVTPSQWLADLAAESYLSKYPIKVIHNGIDLNTFKPTQSDFRTKYYCQDKRIVLGVAFGWGIRKGLDVFIELSKRLPDDYQIVLVGTEDNIDAQLPSNIISIHRTQNQRQLAEIYSAADVLVNPTREDNFPTVNMEALACGTPVITFQTGGSPEMLDDTCGNVVACDDVDALEAAVRNVCENRPFNKQTCIKRAEQFDKNNKFREYIALYHQMR